MQHTRHRCGNRGSFQLIFHKISYRHQYLSYTISLSWRKVSKTRVVTIDRNRWSWREMWRKTDKYGGYYQNGNLRLHRLIFYQQLLSHLPDCNSYTFSTTINRFFNFPYKSPCLHMNCKRARMPHRITPPLEWFKERGSSLSIKILSQHKPERLYMPFRSHRDNQEVFRVRP